MTKELEVGTLTTSDFVLIERALHSYLIECIRMQDSERDAHPDVHRVANLLHRIGRIDGS